MARVFGGAIETFRGKFGKLSIRIAEGTLFYVPPLRMLESASTQNVSKFVRSLM
jgi:hypothetical protein